MKKICVFLMFVLSVYGGFSSYATTDIAADAESSECVENITGTYSGDANFKAKWTPNNIQLRWYNNNTLMQGVNTESNTCNYGATLTIPTTAPERTGYIFDGWKVRPTYDFSKLATGGSNALPGYASERWAKGVLDNTDDCWYGTRTGQGTSNVSCTSDSEFTELGHHEWKVQFSTGTTTGMLYGSAYCSGKSGNSNHGQWNTVASFATTDELEIVTGIWCWCQATGWKPYSNNPNDIIYGQNSVSASSVWVTGNGYSFASQCAQNCAERCSTYAAQNSAFRRALFVGTGE